MKKPALKKWNGAVMTPKGDYISTPKGIYFRPYPLKKKPVSIKKSS
jgi:hypothetical protein